MSERESLPNDAKGWLEFVKNIDLKDHKKAAIGLGVVAAVGIGVGVYTAKNGKKFFIGYGDRRLQAKGLIGMGELEAQGTAISGVERPEVLEDDLHHDWFSMDAEDGFGYPGEQPEHAPKYLRAARKIADVFHDHFAAQQSDELPPHEQ